MIDGSKGGETLWRILIALIFAGFLGGVGIAAVIYWVVK